MTRAMVACAGAAAAFFLSAGALAQSTLDRFIGEFLEVSIDSGPRVNPNKDMQIVWSEVITVPDAAWLRLYFGAVELGEGSYLRVTSLKDGEVQPLDRATVAMWENSTAYFNGESVLLEVVAAPGDSPRVVVKKLGLELPRVGPEGSPGQCGICNNLDARQPSTKRFSPRIMPVGCTGTIYTSNSNVVTAGHCTTGSNYVLHFNVPASNSNCSTNAPPVADQFPLQVVTFVNGGVGADWSVCTTGTNNLGQRPFQRYGSLLPISPTLGAAGQAAEIFGYGVDQTCVRSQTQQFSPGNIIQRFASYYDFDNDVRGGNSGSGYLRNRQIIGVVTHCRTSCPNIATRVDVAAFANARNALGGLQCRADFNGDGQVDFFDYLDFVAEYAAGRIRADFNDDDQVDFFDYLDFVAAYSAGC